MASDNMPKYMRCTKCLRVISSSGIERKHGCVCGGNEFWAALPTWIERMICWLLNR